MANFVSVTRYREQISWNNDYPVMVTNFNMLASISIELILAPHVCTLYDQNKTAL